MSTHLPLPEDSQKQIGSCRADKGQVRQTLMLLMSVPALELHCSCIKAKMNHIAPSRNHELVLLHLGLLSEITENNV